MVTTGVFFIFNLETYNPDSGKKKIKNKRWAVT